MTATVNDNSMNQQSRPYLTLARVSKHFPGVQALKEVSLDAYAGEVLGLVGVNGAGKSTLMNVLAGIVQPDEGTIEIAGRMVEVLNPRMAEDLGIAFIQQEIQVFSQLKVYENILIANLHNWRVAKHIPILSIPKLKLEAKKYLEMLDCGTDPGERVERLSVGERQMVQIARALSQGGRILLIDEPTSSLSMVEKSILFEVIRKLRDSGFAIIYITHYLDEVYEICDKVVVLRDGRTPCQGKVGEVSKTDLIRYMIGRDIELISQDNKRKVGETILEANGITGLTFPRDVSFHLREGEILGIWGALGSGRTELLRALVGFDKLRQGSVLYRFGADLKTTNRKKLLRHIGFITEERHFDGLFLQMPIWQNISSASLRTFASRMFRIMNRRSEIARARSYMDEVNIHAAGVDMLLNQLSGGNQQKTIIAKWMMKGPKVMIMDEPTRGVDIGAKAEIQQIIFEKARSGMSFIIVSSELDEITVLCDRIIVLRKGRISCELTKKDFSKDRLMSEA